MTEYQFTKTPCAVDRLEKEIKDSTIAVALDHITLFGSALSVFFKAGLSSAEQTTLSTLVTNHGGTPLPDTPAPKDADGAPLVRTRAFANPDNMKFRGTGKSATCTKTTTTNVDYKLTEDRYLNGVQMIVKNHVIGDKVQLKVIDIDNILGYGANVVLDQFGKDWFLAEDKQDQGIIQLDYAALVLNNLYIRMEYVSVGTVNDVLFHANLFLHKKG